MDEPWLIEQAQKGDVTAYNRLVLHYQDAVYNLAYRITGESGLAADVTQEAFISAYRALGQFRGGNFKAWLLRIVTNATYDELRRRKRQRESSLDEIVEENESSPLLVGNNEPGPEEQQQRAELIAADPRSAELIKPWLRGKDTKRWRPEWAGVYVIAIQNSPRHLGRR